MVRTKTKTKRNRTLVFIVYAASWLLPYDIFGIHYYLVTQIVKNLPAMQETWVQSPGGEDHLEEGMATHSSILTWRIP